MLAPFPIRRGQLTVGALMVLGRLEILPFAVLVVAAVGDEWAQWRLSREVEED